MRQMLLCALLALAACNPPATNTLTEAPVVELGASGSETLVIKSDGKKENAVVFQFANGQILHAVEIGPVGGAYVAPDIGQAPQGLAVLLKAPTDGTPILGYDVESEAGANPLCGAKEVVSIALMIPESGNATLAAITGAHFGEDGSLICNIREVALTNTAPSFEN